MAKNNLDNIYNGLVDEAEDGVTRNILRATFRVISQMCVCLFKQRTECAIANTDGTLCASVDETLNRWREHYETMLIHAPVDTCPDLDTLSVSCCNTDP